jgi:hypothetical protein
LIVRVDCVPSVKIKDGVLAAEITDSFIEGVVVPIPTFCDEVIYIALVEFVAKPSAFVAGKYMPFVGTEALPGTML